MTWIREQVAQFPAHVRGLPVLEVGSYDVNGSVRPLFASFAMYTGVDIRPGPGVDQVVTPGTLPFPDGGFGVVVSAEMLEHDPCPWNTVREMGRVLCHGGVLLLTTRGIGFPKHDHPSDYWRFTPEAIRLLLSSVAGLNGLDVTEDPEASGVFAKARKGAPASTTTDCGARVALPRLCGPRSHGPPTSFRRGSASAGSNPPATSAPHRRALARGIAGSAHP